MPILSLSMMCNRIANKGIPIDKYIASGNYSWFNRVLSLPPSIFVSFAVLYFLCHMFLASNQKHNPTPFNVNRHGLYGGRLHIHFIFLDAYVSFDFQKQCLTLSLQPRDHLRHRYVCSLCHFQSNSWISIPMVYCVTLTLVIRWKPNKTCDHYCVQHIILWAKNKLNKI